MSGALLSRRRFVRQATGGLVGFALARLLATPRALAGPVSIEYDRWLRGIDEECRDLQRRALRPAEWQTKIEGLLSAIDRDELFAAIDFDELRRGLDYPDLGVTTARVRFPGIEGLPERLGFYPKLFGVGPGRAIIPHGHRNMASAHLVLDGTFRLRQYDKREDEGDALIVEPVVDQQAGPGHASTISDDARNVHWLIAGRTPAHTLDVILTNIDPDVPSYEIDNVDPDRAESVGNGLLRIPKLDVDTALRRYGKSHHAATESDRG